MIWSSGPLRRVGLLALVHLFVASASNCWAAELTGIVVRIADGDTISVLDELKHQHRVRLATIDAPERHQDFGNVARQQLASIVFNKRVVVEWTKRDRYGRIIGKVLFEGRDVGLDMIQAGLSWHYKAFESEQDAADRLAYSLAESQARGKRVGLWRVSTPVPPWEFRRRKR